MTVDGWQRQAYIVGAMPLIKKHLADKKLTAAEFARSLGVSEAAVCRWLNGQRRPDYPNLKLIASALGVPVERLDKDFGL